MTKPTIVAFCKLTDEQMNSMDQDYNMVWLHKEQNPDAALNTVKDNVQGIIAAIGNKIQANIFEACPNLEIIALKSVGFDYVDMQQVLRRDIVVTNTPDVVTNDTADTALALLLNVSRRFVELDAYTRVGKWSKVGSQPLSVSVSGKKVGIAGLGRIGKAIAHRCEAFDMEVSYFGRHKKDNIVYQFYDDLKMMAHDVDYLVMAVPGGVETQNIVNTNVLNALGSNGYLINISRGSVVDESALIEALKNNVIAGAGLDVYANEPHVPDDLKTMDNVVLFPHIAGFTHENMHNMGELVLENLRLHFAGETVKTPVN